ncbi:MAG: hypothetical protein ACI8WB_003430 [Phenylobacterium sp.]|jgi:hypothetical protein
MKTLNQQDNTPKQSKNEKGIGNIILLIVINAIINLTVFGALLFLGTNEDMALRVTTYGAIFSLVISIAVLAPDSLKALFNFFNK